MDRLSDQLDQEFCDILLGIDALMKRVGEEYDFADFNLTGENGRDWIEDERRATRLVQEFSRKLNWQDHPRTLSRVRAVKAFLDDRAHGGATPINDIIRSATGIVLPFIPLQKIDMLDQQSFAAFERLTGSPAHDMYELQAQIKPMVDRIAFKDLNAHFRSLHATVIPLLEKMLETDLDFNFRFENVNRKDLFWNAFITTDGKNSHFRMNEAHAPNLYPRRHATRLFLHEIGAHAVQACLWRKNIENGSWPKHFGILPLVAPEAVQMEGLAEFMPGLLMYGDGSDDNKLDPLCIIERNLDLRNRYVENNAGALLVRNASDPSHQAVRDYLGSGHNAAIFNADDYLSVLEDSTEDKFCYYGTYGPGMHLVGTGYAQAEDPNAYIQHIYKKWLLPSEIAPAPKSQYGWALGI